MEAGFEIGKTSKPYAWEVLESKRIHKLQPGKAAAAELAVFDCGSVELKLDLVSY